MVFPAQDWFLVPLRAQPVLPVRYGACQPPSSPCVPTVATAGGRDGNFGVDEGEWGAFGCWDLGLMTIKQRIISKNQE